MAENHDPQLQTAVADDPESPGHVMVRTSVILPNGDLYQTVDGNVPNSAAIIESIKADQAAQCMDVIEGMS